MVLPPQPPTGFDAMQKKRHGRFLWMLRCFGNLRICVRRSLRRFFSTFGSSSSSSSSSSPASSSASLT
jgi:hypothetical protein